MAFPKIELHVHLEGTVRAPALLEMAKRNDVALPADLSADYAAALSLGLSTAACYAAGVRGALCDDDTRKWLARIGAEFDWSGVISEPCARPAQL